MHFHLSVPRESSDPITIDPSYGQSLFILGANGTGKSSLLIHLYEQNIGNAIRVIAHRQNWLSSNSLSLSPQERQHFESNLRDTNKRADSRWKDPNGEARVNLVIYDLFNSENARARAIARAIDGREIELAVLQSERHCSPLGVINELLRLSNIPVEISMSETDEIMARKTGGTSFSAAELSDGERNALLVAAIVLTAKPGTLILIDEPERHMHRSIISPLLSNLFARRSDCAFVISTHDVSLPADTPKSIAMLVRGCTHIGTTAEFWDADVLGNDIVLDDDLRTAILGARRRLLFVEGNERSMDKPLYSLVFPDVTVVPKSSCRDVEHAVSQLRDSELLHWMRAFGIVDHDRRVSSDITRLQESGIYAVPAFSVESIYYHPVIQRSVAQRYTDSMGGDTEKLLTNAKQAVLKSVAPHIKRLSDRAAEKTIRAALFGALPNFQQISEGSPIKVEIDVSGYVAEERKQFDIAVANADIEYIIARYPIRETSALTEIARALRFQCREDYERAVLKLLQDDPEVLAFVRTLFGTLYEDITRA